MTCTKNLNEPLCGLLNDFFSGLNHSDKTSDSYLNEIKNHLKENNMALCVGAGITSYFVGDWRELLNKLLVMRCVSTLLNTPPTELAHKNETLSKNNFAELEDYISNLKAPFLSIGISPLEIGEYLMYDPDDDAPTIGIKNESLYRETFFAEQVRHIILSSIEEKLSGTDLEDYFLASNIDTRLGTLVSVVKLCLKKDITNIITYNFDTILDRLLASRVIREKFGAAHISAEVHIYTYQKAAPIVILKSDPGQEAETVINIYHVHGVINDETEEPQQPIIFSENSYQSYQQTSLNWSNIRMADIMTRFHTLCIGFSGDDTNFRMLRHFLSQREDNPVMGEMGEKKELYLMRVFERDIKNLADPSNTIDSANANKHQECAYTCVKTYFHIINAYFEKQLNTHIIWSGSFSEMAQQISELSET